MSVGLAFFRRLLEQGEPLTFMQDFRLSPDYFTTKEEKKVLKHIERYLQRYAKLPSVKTLRRITKIELPKITDAPLKFWADSVAGRRTAKVVVKALQNVLEKAKDNDYDAMQEVAKFELSNLVSIDRSTETVLFGGAGASVLVEHDERQLGENIQTVPFGFQYLDEVSGGAHPGDLIVLAGDTGLGKSYTLCKMALSAYDSGAVPMIVSMEMSSKAITRRLLALRNTVSETYIRRGMLSTLTSRKRIEEDIAEISRLQPFYILDGQLVLKIEDLIPQIWSYRPSIIYVDGAYLLQSRSNNRGGSRWDDMIDTATKLKIISSSLNIPIIATYQLRDKKEIWGGKAMKHLASILLYLVPDDGPGGTRWDREETRMISIEKGRYGEIGKFRISYNMFYSIIEQIEVVRPQRAIRGSYGRD